MEGRKQRNQCLETAATSPPAESAGGPQRASAPRTCSMRSSCRRWVGAAAHSLPNCAPGERRSAHARSRSARRKQGDPSLPLTSQSFVFWTIQVRSQLLQTCERAPLSLKKLSSHSHQKTSFQAGRQGPIPLFSSLCKSSYPREGGSALWRVGGRCMKRRLILHRPWRWDSPACLPLFSSLAQRGGGGPARAGEVENRRPAVARRLAVRDHGP